MAEQDNTKSGLLRLTIRYATSGAKQLIALINKASLYCLHKTVSLQATVQHLVISGIKTGRSIQTCTQPIYAGVQLWLSEPY